MDQNSRLCTICLRRFSNGKALGAHMKSHFGRFSSPSSTSSSNPPLASSKHELSSESTGSAKYPAGKRSKTLRKFSSNMAMTGSPSDSVSSPLSVEDAALCLLMLSRDQRSNNPKLTQEDDEFFGAAKVHPKRYKCGTCNRTFRSHQALGGHRASHKLKSKKISQEEEEDDDENGGDTTDHKIHQQRTYL
ncbi:hypothetical protein GOBAR_AA21436 [Gossypium barbadense]|uniref:C2H2-type domain-containing protein n=1 Tax=Gossypium barbadense TaxID=3634 RepID=A0A2P5X7E3_GOSBA|nr:hypothetical protein GOBAR_AA21436 [Gossypium barbadense]